MDKWIIAKKQLDDAKALELELRNRILPKVLGDKQSGSKTTLFGGHKVTATARLNYNLDVAEYDLISDTLTTEERLCIQWRPSVNQSKYSKLPESSALRQVVTVKPGQGALEVKS